MAWDKTKREILDKNEKFEAARQGRKRSEKVKGRKALIDAVKAAETWLLWAVERREERNGIRQRHRKTKECVTNKPRVCFDCGRDWDDESVRRAEKRVKEAREACRKAGFEPDER